MASKFCVVRANMQGLILPETGSSGSLGQLHPAEKLWSSHNVGMCGYNRMAHEVQLVVLREPFSAGTMQLRGKLTLQHLNSRCKHYLWLHSGKNLAWMDNHYEQLVTWDAGKILINPSESMSTAGCGTRRCLHASDLKMCSKLCEEGQTSDALSLLIGNQLADLGCHVDKQILICRCIKWCILQEDMTMGREIHALRGKCELKGDAFLATHLMNAFLATHLMNQLYASHRKLEKFKMMQVFTKVSTLDVHNWTAIIFVNARLGGEKMEQDGLRCLDFVLYSCMWQACASVGAGALHEGKQLHAAVIEKGLQLDHVVLRASLVTMYAKCSSGQDACRVFHTLPAKDVVTWIEMMAIYVKQEMGQEALKCLYSCMQHNSLSALRLDVMTHVCLLQTCVSVGIEALHEDKQIEVHEDKQIEVQELQSDLVLGGSVYAKCESVKDACQVFDRPSTKNCMIRKFPPVLKIIKRFIISFFAQDIIHVFYKPHDNGSILGMLLGRIRLHRCQQYDDLVVILRHGLSIPQSVEILEMCWDEVFTIDHDMPSVHEVPLVRRLFSSGTRMLVPKDPLRFRKWKYNRQIAVIFTQGVREQ